MKTIILGLLAGTILAFGTGCEDSVRVYKEKLAAKEASQQRQREFATQQAVELYKQKAEYNRQQREIEEWNTAMAAMPEVEQFCRRHPEIKTWAQLLAALEAESQ
jgi:hypothetical protein